MGRPTALTPDLHHEIVQRVRNGQYLDDAALQSGIASSTVRLWMTKGHDALADAAADGHDEIPTEDPRWVYGAFSAAIDVARAAARYDMVQVIRRGAVGQPKMRTLPDGRTEPDTDEHGNVDWILRPDPKWALEYLARTDPERWARAEARRSDAEAADDLGSLEDEKAAALRAADEVAAMRDRRAG